MKRNIEMKQIDSYCKMVNGHGFKPRDWVKNGMPIIRIQNLNGSRDFNYFNGEIDPKWIIEHGDLLFAWAGTRGVSFGPTIWDGPRGLLNQHIYKVVPEKNVNKGWLYAALLVATSRIEKMAHGFKSTLLHVHKSDIVGQTIYDIDYHGQNEIASILEIWDLAINLQEQRLDMKEALRKGLMQQIFSGKLRFPKFVKTKDARTTKYGNIPKDWKYPKIQDVASSQSLKNKNGRDLPVLSCTKHKGLVDSLKYFGKRIYSEDISTYKIVKRNQFAYATNHIEEGSIGYQNLYDAAAISPMYTVFETNNKVDDSFLYLLLKTEKYRHIFEAHTNASVDRRGSLRWKDFSSLHIPLPEIDEQKAIAKIFKLVDTELELLNEQLNALKEQKKGLMQQLLTGKTRVRTTEAA